MTNTTQTLSGPVPHFAHRGQHYPVAVESTGGSRLPTAKTNKQGYGLYALPGGGEATADQIRDNDTRGG